jgi:hypothetical protein
METQKDHRVVLRTIRDALVDFFIAFAHLVFFWLPGGDVTHGKALMAFHPIFMVSIVALFFVVPSYNPLRIIIVLITMLVVASQWLLGGCVITRAEQKLTGDKITILDPFLTLAKISVNRDTRNAATVAASTAVLVMLIWCVFCDNVICSSVRAV